MVSSKETLGWIRDVALILFGYVAFLRQIYLWSNDIIIVVVFGILLVIILFLAGLIPNLKNTKGGEE